eukprot:TRINITY_DN5100_c0_g1_i1.p2 TRINITY_DN5100_c0_g1~~TRINITY_DN5100_c0_g1_i1.p2  ORF type:complete len:233 (-),score=78.39 TRINITY_DN5100_c0_g1_i1:104-802(-)
MDVLLAITGNDFALVATDSGNSRSIFVLKDDQDKITELDSHKLLACGGDEGDRSHFTEYIKMSLDLKYFKTGIRASTKAAATFTRRTLASALRTQGAYQCNLLLVGYDTKKDIADPNQENIIVNNSINEGPVSLFFVDHLASMQKVDFAAHGYAGYFVYGLIDRHFKKGMTKDEALKLLQMCMDEICRRFIYKPPNFVIKCISKDGIEIISKPESHPVPDAGIAAPMSVSSS